MKLWEMFSCHIVLLLLTWRCSAVSGNSEPIDEELLDQVATASVVRLRNTTANHSTLERPFRDVEITTIRYENSNGFVPIAPETQTVTTLEETTFAENYSVDRNYTSEEHLSLFIRSPEYSKNENSLENDPFFSTEARIFVSLMQPVLNRRSSDSSDSSDDFELLRINNDTPTVANYQNFYDSLTGRNQDVHKKGKEVGDQNTEPQFHQNRQNLEREKNYFDNQVRNNKMGNYLLNYDQNPAAEDERNALTGGQYFSYSQIHDDQNKNGYRESINVRNNFPITENVEYNSKKKGKTSQNFRATQQQNYNQHDVASNQFNPQSTQKVNSPTDLTLNHHQRHPKQKLHHNSHRSRLNVKQHMPAKTRLVTNVKSNLEDISPRSQNYNLNTRHEEPSSYFEHEALFSREENNHNYEKIEEAKELSDENYEYVEITEKPKRFRKLRKRPSDSVDSKRLPKEHRDFEDPIDIDDTIKPKTRFRPKTRNHKPSVHSWPERENPVHEEDTDEGGYDATVESTVNSETRKPKFYNHNHKTQDNSWASISPNVEISHSSGIEIDQTGKPKLVVPIKVNLVPLGNFDHATALGNSQGFDLSNAVLQNFVTATPIAFNNGQTISPIASILNTPHNIFGQNIVKGLQNLQSQNIKVQTSVPDVIVGQNTFQNPIQTILVPQQNYQTQQKFGPNVRNTFLQNNQNTYSQNPVPNLNLQPTNFNVIQQNLPSHNLQGNLPIQNSIYNPNQNAVQHFQNPNANQIQNIHSTSQFNNPHPTSQTFENFQQNGGQSVSHYNVQINPNGLQGQTLTPTQNLYTSQGNVVYSTTPTTNYLHNGNLETTDSHGKRNTISGTNGQFLASASLTVGEQIQNQINAQNLRPQLHENFHQVFRHDNLLPKTKGFVQNAEATQTILNLHNQNGPVAKIMNRDHQAEQISQASNAIAQTYKDQNQQILKVANDIFESTLKQLKQLQRSQSSKPTRLGNQHSQSLENANFQNFGTKNVEIINPNSRPSPLDQTPNNPSDISHNYGGISFTTPFPIFATTAFDASPRPPILSTIGPLSIHGYVDSLTEIGAKENDLKTSPTTNSRPKLPEHRLEPVLFNPINFVPSIETLKSQKALNNKYNVQEPLLQGLNLVPLIPGGNFYKNSYFAQDDLASKPKLSSDLQKYAEEMFKESLKTIYNTQKWNNDHKAQGSDISSITTSPKGKEDLHNLKFSMPDIKPSKQILEAHYTETGSKDTNVQLSGHSPKPSDELKKLPPSTPDVADILKPDFKLPPPISLEPVRFYYKPNIHLSRPTISDINHPDFKFNPDLGSADFLHDFLTPPKPNAFISKSPFNELIPKRRPGHKRPFSDNGNVKFYGRPENGLSRPLAGVVESAASNIAHQSFPSDASKYEFSHNRPSFDHESQDFEADYQNNYSRIRGQSIHSRYPSLTTSSPLADDYHKPSFNNYDYNHPRMHNLMGLLRKNKRLPPGNSQSLFAKKEETNEPFENGGGQNFEEISRGFAEEKSDAKNFEINVNSNRTERSHA